MSKQKHVLMVMGSGLSGSTMISSIIGAHDAAVYMGEMHHHGRRFFNERWEINDTGISCTCGSSLGNCSFWNKLMQQCHLKSSSYDESVLIDTIFEMTQKSVMIDSSRVPSRKRFYERYVKRRRDTKLHFLYLFRDPRGQAFSYVRNNYRDVDRRDEPFRWQLIFLRILITKWLKHNLAGVLLYRLDRRFHFLKYEDVVRRPEQALAPLMKDLGLSFQASQQDYYKQERHTLDGNLRVRLNMEPVRRVNNYHRKIPAISWYLATMAALPFILCLGYPFSRKDR